MTTVVHRIYCRIISYSTSQVLIKQTTKYKMVTKQNSTKKKHQLYIKEADQHQQGS